MRLMSGGTDFFTFVRRDFWTSLCAEMTPLDSTVVLCFSRSVLLSKAFLFVPPILVLSSNHRLGLHRPLAFVEISSQPMR